jgi:hypothetical protein
MQLDRSKSDRNRIYFMDYVYCVMKRNVSKEELDAFVKAYPRTLKKNINGIMEPPLLTYNDFTLGDWPQSVVAHVVLFEDSYIPDLLNQYYITEPNS